MRYTDLPFLKHKHDNHIHIHLIREGELEGWLSRQGDVVRNQAARMGLKGKAEEAAAFMDKHGNVDFVLACVHSPIGIYDLAFAVQAVEKAFDSEAFGAVSFSLKPGNLRAGEMENAYIGWALGCYHYSAYRQKQPVKPGLLVTTEVDMERVEAFARSVFLLRDMINAPSNDLGPDELEKAVRDVATVGKAKVKVIKDKELLKENFPLIYMVGSSSPRLPRLIEMVWGNAKDPKVTLVGKGVCFDTGGLNLKPTGPMANMKKDMGGAAHTLALASLIMALNLPVRLQLLIPAVENSVSGTSFRPGDIVRSRKGLFVENTNTDAEGRLILADTLTYASEGSPEIIIDYATLTGSARAGLGPDIPAFFSNNADICDDLKKMSFEEDDPVWPMPLWAPYKKHIEKSTGDLVNSASLPGDLIYSALFLQSFLTEGYEADWVHLDCYAWEHTGRAGRPAGGADTGLRSVFAYIEKRYGRS